MTALEGLIEVLKVLLAPTGVAVILLTMLRSKKDGRTDPPMRAQEHAVSAGAVTASEGEVPSSVPAFALAQSAMDLASGLQDRLESTEQRVECVASANRTYVSWILDVRGNWAIVRLSEDPPAAPSTKEFEGH